MQSRHRLWCLLILFGVGMIGLIAGAGCGRRSPDEHIVSDGYLGNAACAPCHAAEFKAHQASRHNVTLRTVDRASMGADWPSPGPVGDAGLAVFATGAGLTMGWRDRPAEARPMQYVLGSDRFAYTFISLVGNQALIELPESYYHPNHAWLLTPGHTPEESQPLGHQFNEDLARHCLGCHMTALPDSGVTPDPRFFGVGCEACHGPGREHVEAVRAGDKTHLHMERLESIGATKLNTLCGRCHRTADNILPEQSDMTQRFEPYGLMKSRCFRESGDTLSCATCHDSHTDTSTDRKQYERICKSCHVPSRGFGPTRSMGKPCPVNPYNGCIPCHMPKRKVTVDAPFEMSDHYIRVVRERPHMTIGRPDIGR